MQIEYEFEVISYQRLSPEQTTHFTLTSNCKIGRSSDCDLQLPDPEKILSSKHARVELINGQYYIWDLSTNGLFINNGEDPLGKEEYHKLKDGDLLSLGDYELAVKRLPDRPVEEFASPTERIPAEEKAIPPIPMAPKMEEPPFPNGSEFNINEELEADVALAPVLSNFSAGIDDNVSSADIAIPSDWNFNFDPGLESARPNETAALKKELVEPFHSHETQAMNSPETQAMNSAETKQFNSAETQAMNSAETQAMNSAETQAMNSAETQAMNSAETQAMNSAETQAMNSAETQAMNSAESKEFNSAETQAMNSAESKEFNLPESKEFNLPDSKEFNLPESKEFNLPESKEFNLPESKEFNLPESKEFNLPESKEFNLPESKEFNLPETPPLETPPLISAETMPLNAAATLPLNAAAKKFNSPESKQFNSPEAPALTSAATMPLNAAAKQFDSPFTEPLHTTTKQSEQKKNIDVVSEALKTALNTHRQIPDEQLQKLVKESFKEQNIPQTNISENLSKFESRFSTKQALIKNKEFTMFMKGLGVQDLIYKKFATMGTYFELGQSMRLMFLGLSKMIKTRVAFKKEHKISRTIFKHKENNPLKFSISMDDIYQNLYAHKISSFLPAKQAIKEAFMDTLHHEEALKAGMLSAIQSVIMQLDPKIINSKNKEGNFWSNLIPGNKKAENWNAYKALHRNLKEEVKLHGNITLNEAFIKTYNEKIKSLK